MHTIWIGTEQVDMSEAVISMDRTEQVGATVVPVVDVTFEPLEGHTYTRTFRGQEACDAVYRYWLSETHPVEETHPAENVQHSAF